MREREPTAWKSGRGGRLGGAGGDLEFGAHVARMGDSKCQPRVEITRDSGGAKGRSELGKEGGSLCSEEKVVSECHSHYTYLYIQPLKWHARMR